MTDRNDVPRGRKGTIDVDSKRGSALGRARSLAGRARQRLRGGNGPDEVTTRLDRQHGRIAAVERDLARVGPQLAGLEARFEDLRERLDRPEVDEGDLSEAMEVVDEVRREHERIRARLSAAARFEERLRQLEEQVARLSESDPPAG